MRLAMSDEIATEDDPTAEGYEVDTFAARGPDGPDSDDEDDDPEAKKTSQGTAPAGSVGAGAGGSRSAARREEEVVFEIGDEEDEADQSRDNVARKGDGRGERQGLMSSDSANNSEETLVPGAGGAQKRADKND